MKCHKFERWISDGIDHALNEKKSKLLRVHLERCFSCRSYEESLGNIQHFAENLDRPQASPEYWKGFRSRLKERMRLEEADRGRVQASRLEWKWAWGAILVLMVGLTFSWLSLRRASAHDLPLFSLEDSLDRYYQKIGDNAELEYAFNAVIENSIIESGTGRVLEQNLHLLDDPLIWESLSEEELKLLEQEVKKEIKT